MFLHHQVDMRLGTHRCRLKCSGFEGMTFEEMQPQPIRITKEDEGWQILTNLHMHGFALDGMNFYKTLRNFTFFGLEMYVMDFSVRKLSHPRLMLCPGKSHVHDPPGWIESFSKTCTSTIINFHLVLFWDGWFRANLLDAPGGGIVKLKIFGSFARFNMFLSVMSDPLTSHGRITWNIFAACRW